MTKKNNDKDLSQNVQSIAGQMHKMVGNDTAILFDIDDGEERHGGHCELQTPGARGV